MSVWLCCHVFMFPIVLHTECLCGLWFRWCVVHHVVISPCAFSIFWCSLDSSSIKTKAKKERKEKEKRYIYIIIVYAEQDVYEVIPFLFFSLFFFFFHNAWYYFDIVVVFFWTKCMCLATPSSLASLKPTIMTDLMFQPFTYWWQS